MSETKGRNREEIARGSCLSIALHPVITDDSGQALDLPPNPSGLSYRCDFGGQQQAPFARAPETEWNYAPGYSWLPHLYQENTSVDEDSGKDELKFKPVVFEKVLQLERRKRNVLRGDQQFAAESRFGGAPPQRLFS